MITKILIRKQPHIIDANNRDVRECVILENREEINRFIFQVFVD